MRALRPRRQRGTPAPEKKRQAGHKPDMVLLGVTLFLVVFGLIMLSSASSIVSFEAYGDSYYLLKHQLLFGVLVGLVAMVVAMRIPYQLWQKHATVLCGIGVVSLLVVFLPGLGTDLGRGAHSWISLGPLGVLQPSEIMKLLFIFYVASWLTARHEHLGNLVYGVLPFFAMLGMVSLLIMLQPDLGTLSIIVVSIFGMYVVAGARWHHVLAVLVIVSMLFVLVTKFSAYRSDRIQVFLNPEADPQGIGYQVNQSLLALGSGGIFGFGLGNSRQKYNYLPEVTGDSIFAVIGEELGFAMSAGLVVLYMLIAWRCYRIIRTTSDFFGQLVVVGCMVWLTFQAFVNISGLLAIMPLTGVTLPLVSYGGTSMIVTLAAIGVVLNISRSTVPTTRMATTAGRARGKRTLSLSS